MARLGADPFIHADCTITDAEFGAYTEIGKGSRVINTRFGDYSYCDRQADIANARIGKFANIAACTRIGPTAHPMEQASLHHFLYRSHDYWDDAGPDAEFFDRRAARIVHIGHDSWIGHGAVVMPGVTIGIGAVVGAGALVTRDVAPYQIVTGLPARPTRLRFDADVVVRLLALEWWDWDHEVLRARLPDFRKLPVRDFLDRYERG